MEPNRVINVFTSLYALAQAVALGHKASFGQERNTFVLIENPMTQGPWRQRLEGYEGVPSEALRATVELLECGFEAGWIMVVNDEESSPYRMTYLRLRALGEMVNLSDLLNPAVPNPPSASALDRLSTQDVWSFLIAHLRAHNITLRLNVIGDRQF